LEIFLGLATIDPQIGATMIITSSVGSELKFSSQLWLMAVKVAWQTNRYEYRPLLACQKLGLSQLTKLITILA